MEPIGKRDDKIAVAVRELVAAHRKLSDVVITAALWLKTAKPGVWVLEVVSGMPADSKADEPMEFAPSKGFRFTLNLLLAREKDFRAAIRRNQHFAAMVADAAPIPPDIICARTLQVYARQHVPTSPSAAPNARCSRSSITSHHWSS